MTSIALASIGAGLVAIGAGVGIGQVWSSGLQGMSRQPEMSSKIQTSMFIGAALVGSAYWDLRRQSKAAGQRFDAALRRNAADVFDKTDYLIKILEEHATEKHPARYTKTVQEKHRVPPIKFSKTAIG